VVATKPTGGGRGAAKDRAHDYVKRQVLTGGFPGGELISEGEVAAVSGYQLAAPGRDIVDGFGVKGENLRA